MSLKVNIRDDVTKTKEKKSVKEQKTKDEQKQISEAKNKPNSVLVEAKKDKKENKISYDISDFLLEDAEDSAELTPSNQYDSSLDFYF